VTRRAWGWIWLSFAVVGAPLIPVIGGAGWENVRILLAVEFAIAVLIASVAAGIYLDDR